MIYFATVSTDRIRRHVTAGDLGCMAQPGSNRVEPGWLWAADNGCFADKWTASKWLAFLERNTKHAENCRFAVVPDRLADPDETDRLWRIWAPVVAELGYPTAYVAQDGARSYPDNTECLFIGGTTAWKLSPDARRLAFHAHNHGVWVHWGRVNSRRRMTTIADLADSCDGSFLAFGPDKNIGRLLSWSHPLELRTT